MIVNIVHRHLFWNPDSSGIAPTTLHNKNIDCLAELKRNCKSNMGVEAAIRESYKHVFELFEAFKHQVRSLVHGVSHSFAF